MAVKPSHSISRPSSLAVRKLVNIQLHKNKIPASIWPNKNPTPNLDPPIINALDSCIQSPTHLSQILAQFFVSGHHHDSFIAGHFVKQFARSLSPPVAVSLFSLLQNPDAFMSNTIIKSFISISQPEKALAFYRKFVANSPITPNNFTFPLLAKLFSQLGLAKNGILLHTQIVKLGFEADLYVKNSLIHMHNCFGDVSSAWKLFERSVDDADVITWNSMIDGCAKNGMVDVARELFDEMPDRDLISWNVMIAGYASVGEMGKARELFLTTPERDVVTCNSMLDGYAKVGNVALSRELFDSMGNKSVVSWNVMLALYARVKDYGECMRLFEGMIAVAETKPNEATFVSVLTACAHLGDLGRGKWIHTLMERLEGSDVLLMTALLTMYAKCGAMEDAREVFDKMGERSVVTWNSMIMGYGLHGLGDKAVELFFDMEKGGVRPNEKTFLCILCACAHKGLVVEGLRFFERMARVYDIEPKVEHIGCVVDLLGRAGLWKGSVEELAKSVKGEVRSKALWGALMSASTRARGNWSVGEVLGRKMVEMEPGDVGAYVLLSNVYAAEGRWDEVEKVREMMRKNGVKKGAGVSLVSGREFEFKILEGEESSICKNMIMGDQCKLSQSQGC